MENIKIFACSKYAEPFTQEICDYLKLPMGKINTMKFKNDNNFVQILETVREHDVYLVQSNVPPVNERIMELLITIDAVKSCHRRRISRRPYRIRRGNVGETGQNVSRTAEKTEPETG